MSNLKFVCKKVKKIRFYHIFFIWLASTFFNTDLFYGTEKILRKEMNKRKRLVKNIKRLFKEPSESTEEKYEKGIQEIERWQKEANIIEKELYR